MFYGADFLWMNKKYSEFENNVAFQSNSSQIGEAASIKIRYQ